MNPTRPAHRADLAKCVMCDDPATQTDAADRWDDGVKWNAPAACDEHSEFMRITGNGRYVHRRNHGRAYTEAPIPRHRVEDVDSIVGAAC